VGELTEDEISRAFWFWYRDYGHDKIDAQLRPFLDAKITGFTSENGGWVSKARQALFLSTGKVAERLKMTRSAYCKLEKNEGRGAVTLNTLAKIADALDCELVYAIRPKKKILFSEIIWQALVKESRGHNWIKSRSKHLKPNALAGIAKRVMKDPQIRRRYEWSER